MAITCSDQASARAGLLGGPKVNSFKRDRMELQAPARSIQRYRVIRGFLRVAVRLYSRVRVEGMERLPDGPSILCFTHESWADPLCIFAAVPGRPRVYFFGPEQEEMRRGFRNRVMRWAGVVVPFRPGNRGLVAATSRAESLLCAGAVVAIAGEGRIHAGENVVLPLRDGPAYLSLRAGVPIVPLAINGTTWLGFRRVVRVRVGLPIKAAPAPAKPHANDILRLTAQIQSALETLVSDFPEQPRPGPVGRWLTELFNDWPEGSRPPIASQPGDRQVAGRTSQS
ncbi:MAG: 1-acyl-sn-glycerol-3-phosphate acyltransferase [Candidatus Limnocylindrales bacterium]|jgi:1-acyl-sn-glycerol-3-phosphate acyltransferase